MDSFVFRLPSSVEFSLAHLISGQLCSIQFISVLGSTFYSARAFRLKVFSILFILSSLKMLIFHLMIRIFENSTWSKYNFHWAPSIWIFQLSKGTPTWNLSYQSSTSDNQKHLVLENRYIKRFSEDLNQFVLIAEVKSKKKAEKRNWLKFWTESKSTTELFVEMKLKL